MTLKQKFASASNKERSHYYVIPIIEDAKIIEKIADYYAIEFAEWCLDNNQIIQNDGKELLEQFKKEKRL